MKANIEQIISNWQKKNSLSGEDAKKRMLQEWDNNPDFIYNFYDDWEMKNLSYFDMNIQVYEFLNNYNYGKAN